MSVSPEGTEEPASKAWAAGAACAGAQKRQALGQFQEQKVAGGGGSRGGAELARAASRGVTTSVLPDCMDCILRAVGGQRAAFTQTGYVLVLESSLCEQGLEKPHCEHHCDGV